MLLADLWKRVKELLGRFRSPNDHKPSESEDVLRRVRELETVDAPSSPLTPPPTTDSGVEPHTVPDLQAGDGEEKPIPPELQPTTFWTPKQPPTVEDTTKGATNIPETAFGQMQDIARSAFRGIGQEPATPAANWQEARGGPEVVQTPTEPPQPPLPPESLTEPPERFVPQTGDTAANAARPAPEVVESPFRTESAVPDEVVGQQETRLAPELVEDQAKPTQPPPTERFDFVSPQTPEEQPTQARRPSFEEVIRNAEDDLAQPLTRRLRIPPEMQGQEMPKPAPGFEVVGNVPGSDSARSENDRAQPMTKEQGESIIRLLEEMVTGNKDVAEKLDEMTSALGNFAQQIQQSVGVAP